MSAVSSPAHAANSSPQLFIGLMSGTSMDGVDGVLVEIPPQFPQQACRSLAFANRGFDASLRKQLQALQAPGENEIEREALAANALVQVYAQVVYELLDMAACAPREVRAIGVHGQTIRHKPEQGFTRQMNNPALLAELTGIDVVADFRSRDVAAGGQGAPLVPAFHHAMFASNEACRVVLNLGGIANISILHSDGNVRGFDTGPGNVLLDTWIQQQRGLDFDDAGVWAGQGQVVPALLQQMLTEPYFALAAPKSTGRDLFDAAWLARHLQAFPNLAAADVQATLCELTAQACAEAISSQAPEAKALFVCGGGAHNVHLMQSLQNRLPQLAVSTTAQLGVPVQEVEAMAFAWLAQRHCLRLAGNLPAVTGAAGLRVLGGLYPAH